jgi:hypothetical protein
MKASEVTGGKRDKLAAALRAERKRRGTTLYGLQKAAAENMGVHMYPHALEGAEREGNSFTIDCLLLYLQVMGLTITITDEKAGRQIYSSEV